MVDLG